MFRHAVMVVALAAGCALPKHRVESAVSFERQAEAALAAGDQERALSLYLQAAEHWRGVGNHKIYAATLDSIARIHKNRGDFDLAVDAWQMALGVAKYAKETDTVLRTLANLGIAHSAWGRYDEALKFYEESLQLAETLKHDASIARLHNNIGTVYRYQGKLDDALERFQKALKIDRRLRDEGAIAARLANIGTVYMDRGEYAKARKQFETALAAARKLGDEDKIAVRLNNVGAASYSLGDYEGALKHYREALEIHNKLGQRHEAATVLSNMGSAYWYLERYGEAEEVLSRSIDIKESLRKGATGDIRRDYLASQIDTYEWLTSTYVRAGSFDKALAAADSSRAKYLTDQLLGAGKELGEPKALTEGYLKQLGSDTAVVYFANVGWNQLLRFVATADGVTATEIDTTAMLARLAPSGETDATSLKGNRDALANAIKAYRELVISVAPADDAERDRQARVFYDSLLGDARALTSRSHLVFVPDGSLAFLPFETLRSKKGYLIEDRLVTYTPSLAVAELIRHRKKADSKHAVLAMGGAEYEEMTETKPVAEASRGQSAWDGRRRQERGLVLTETYAELGYGSFSNLPGTRKEVDGIARIVSDTKVLLGSSVTETHIKRMSRDGELAKYRTLHFATHGIALPETPSLSALVLSQTAKAREGDDGFLTMAEIAKLRIDAEQVVLSACETGLGKLYAGEGVVGLTQSFFVAGARAVAVSLWEVADDSTAELMLSAYDTMQTKGRSFAQAMADAKRGLIKGGRFSRPYYWAPFVHYGSWSR